MHERALDKTLARHRVAVEQGVLPRLVADQALRQRGARKTPDRRAHDVPSVREGGTPLNLQACRRDGVVGVAARHEETARVLQAHVERGHEARGFKAQHAGARFVRRERIQQLWGGVGAAVVDKEQLDARVLRRAEATQRAQGRSQPARAVANRHEDGHLHGRLGA